MTTTQTPVDALAAQARELVLLANKFGTRQFAGEIVECLRDCANQLEASARALAAIPAANTELAAMARAAAFDIACVPREETRKACDMLKQCAAALEPPTPPKALAQDVQGEHPAPYRCLKPHCPPRCSGCNHAIPVTDTPRMLMVNLLDQLAFDDLGLPFEQGDSLAVDAARAWLCSPTPSAEQGYTDGGRNMFFEGRFEGESERDQKRRLQWADDMRAAFERHTGNGWFDKDWFAETGIWTAAWNAALRASSPAEPISIDEIRKWASRRVSCLPPAGVTDMIAFLEEGVRWGEAQHGIVTKEYT